MTDSVRILFAGGCHVSGFPVGPALGFPQLTMEHLNYGAPVKFRALAYANLSAAKRIASECDAYHPDILVLQVGHYECPFPMRRQFRKLIGAKRQAEPAATRSHEYPPTPNSFFEPSLRSAIKARARTAASWAFRLAGSPLFDRQDFRQRLAGLLDGLHELKIRHVFLLGPFPCPDPFMARCRRSATPISAAEAERAGCHFVDVAPSFMDEQGKLIRQLFADPYHLGKMGHRAVGALLAQHIGATIEQTAPAQVPVARRLSPALPATATWQGRPGQREIPITR